MQHGRGLRRSQRRVCYVGASGEELTWLTQAGLPQGVCLCNSWYAWLEDGSGRCVRSDGTMVFIAASGVCAVFFGALFFTALYDLLWLVRSGKTRANAGGLTTLAIALAAGALMVWSAIPTQTAWVPGDFSTRFANDALHTKMSINIDVMRGAALVMVFVLFSVINVSVLWLETAQSCNQLRAGDGHVRRYARTAGIFQLLFLTMELTVMAIGKTDLASAIAMPFLGLAVCVFAIGKRKIVQVLFKGIDFVHGNSSKDDDDPTVALLKRTVRAVERCWMHVTISSCLILITCVIYTITSGPYAWRALQPYGAFPLLTLVEPLLMALMGYLLCAIAVYTHRSNMKTVGRSRSLGASSGGAEQIRTALRSKDPEGTATEEVTGTGDAHTLSLDVMPRAGHKAGAQGGTILPAQGMEL